ncbi:MAG: hypothetical protein ABWY81_06060 [Jiangellaceae bacterium]
MRTEGSDRHSAKARYELVTLDPATGKVEELLTFPATLAKIQAIRDEMITPEDGSQDWDLVSQPLMIQRYVA